MKVLRTVEILAWTVGVALLVTYSASRSWFAYGSERGIASFENMLLRKIKPMRRIRIWFAWKTNAAFGRDQNLLPHRGDSLYDAAVNCLAFATTVNVRMVEERIACFVCRDDCFLGSFLPFWSDLFGIPGACDAHAAV